MKIGKQKIRVGFVVATVLLALASSLSASAAGQQVSAEPTQPVTLRAGSSVPAQLIFHVADGFHINSNQPHSELLIPTKLEFSPAAPLRMGRIHYPAGKDLRLSFDPKEPLSVYSGSFIVAAEVKAALHATPGSYTLIGTLNYQACSDRACYPPRKLPVSVQVRIIAGR